MKSFKNRMLVVIGGSLMLCITAAAEAGVSHTRSVSRKSSHGASRTTTRHRATTRPAHTTTGKAHTTTRTAHTTTRTAHTTTHVKTGSVTHKHITVLPAHHTVVVRGGVTYYVVDGVYYKAVFRNGRVVYVRVVL